MAFSVDVGNLCTIGPFKSLSHVSNINSVYRLCSSRCTLPSDGTGRRNRCGARGGVASSCKSRLHCGTSLHGAVIYNYISNSTSPDLSKSLNPSFCQITNYNPTPRSIHHAIRFPLPPTRLHSPCRHRRAYASRRASGQSIGDCADGQWHGEERGRV